MGAKKNKKNRQERKVANRKLRKGLTENPRKARKAYKKHGQEIYEMSKIIHIVVEKSMGFGGGGWDTGYITYIIYQSKIIATNRTVCNDSRGCH